MKRLERILQMPPDDRIILGAVIGLFLALGIAYSLIVPPVGRLADRGHRSN